jgi:hypothetical protein
MNDILSGFLCVFQVLRPVATDITGEDCRADAAVLPFTVIFLIIAALFSG